MSLAQIGLAAAAKAMSAQLETAALRMAGAVPPPNIAELAAILHSVLAHQAAPPVQVPLAPADLLRDQLIPAVTVPAVARPASCALTPSAAPNMATAEPALPTAKPAASLRLASALNDHVSTRVW